MIYNNLKRILSVTLLLFAVQFASAQTGISSPYSRFGIGQLQSKSVNSRLHGMGGIANAISTSRFVNPSNPASYSAFDSLSFLFDAGLNATRVAYKTTTQTEIGSNATLNYFSLGFPVTKRWHSALGILPYSQVGYNVVIPYENEETGNYNKAFVGEGGLNQVFIGNSFYLGKNFSIGANLTYIFGRYSSISLVSFPDSNLYANTVAAVRTLANDFILDYGLMYKKDLGNNYILSLGATYSQKMNLDVKRDYLVKSVFGGVDGNIEYVLDTVVYTPRVNGALVIPPSAGVGAVIEKKDSWLIGFDANWQNWQNFTAFGVNDSLIDSWNVALGGEYTPNFTSISGYWKRVTYRSGFRYKQTYLKLNGQPINEFGISFGLGLPLPRTLTTIDLSVEFGKTGTTAHNLIQENFINFTMGVSLYERWFVKRKYD
jgi:long-subunit fatty acid transport protein